MARYKLLAQCNAFNGREADFNAWYDNRHIPDMLSVPGFISAERFVLVGEGNHRFLAIYEFDTEDPGAAMAEIGRRAGTPAMPISDSIDGTSAHLAIWQPYSPMGK